MGYVYWSITANGGVFYRNPLWILDGILTVKYVKIYWFFIALFAVYLSMPVLTRITDKVKTFRYAIGLGLIFVATLPLVCSLLGMEFSPASSLSPPIVGGYLLYIFLGYNLSRATLSKKQRYLIYICGILGWAMHFFGTWILSFRAGELVTTFKGYLNLPCVLASIAVFVFFQNCNYEQKLAKFKKLPVEKILDWFAGATFGVYLIHYYFLIFLPDWFGLSPTSWQWRIFGTVIVFLLSAVVVRILQKIPILRRAVP